MALARSLREAMDFYSKIFLSGVKIHGLT